MQQVSVSMFGCPTESALLSSKAAGAVLVPPGDTVSHALGARMTALNTHVQFSYNLMWLLG